MEIFVKNGVDPEDVAWKSLIPELTGMELDEYKKWYSRFIKGPPKAETAEEVEKLAAKGIVGLYATEKQISIAHLWVFSFKCGRKEVKKTTVWYYSGGYDWYLAHDQPEEPDLFDVKVEIELLEIPYNFSDLESYNYKNDSERNSTQYSAAMHGSNPYHYHRLPINTQIPF